MNIPFGNFESETPLTGLGKGRTPVLLIKNFSFSLRDSKGNPHKFSMPILVADVPKISKEGKDRLNRATTIPTLMGMDFLESNRFSFFIDVNNNVSYLEKKE